MMIVLLAQHFGLCFGVRDALAAARDIHTPTQVTIFGQLVHNPLVTSELASRGFQLLSESGRSTRAPATDTVLITAHGISQRERDALLAQGKQLVDTTCPLVRKAHDAALKLQADGCFVIILGRRNHVEVRGLSGDLQRFTIVESPADIRTWPHAKIGIIAQTTTPEREALPLVRQIRSANPDADVHFINTICQPTRDRQAALDELLTRINILVVVGGHHSNNTRQLAARANESGIPAIHIEDPSELDPSLFRSSDIVGLTAGTSTLHETVEAVRQRLESMFPAPHDADLSLVHLN